MVDSPPEVTAVTAISFSFVAAGSGVCGVARASIGYRGLHASGMRRPIQDGGYDEDPFDHRDVASRSDTRGKAAHHGLRTDSLVRFHAGTGRDRERTGRLGRVEGRS